MITGPGVLFLEVIALFIHIFTSTNAKSFIIVGLFVFFVVFIPLYSFEYFRQEFSYDEKKTIRFKKDSKRMEWRGGNIHGKVPHKENTPGKIFRK